MRIDNELSFYSPYSVQNKTINAALTELSTGINALNNMITFIPESEFTEIEQLAEGNIILIYED